MKVKKFSLVFGILFLFLFAIQGVSADATVPIDASWSQTSLTYNAGTTYTVGLNTYITNNVAFLTNYNGVAYCIDIVAGPNPFGYDCDLEGTISSATIARSWIVPSSAINKTLSFKFKIPSRSEEVTSNTLTVLQGSTNDENPDDGGVGYCGDGICGGSETCSNCASDCGSCLNPCTPFSSAAKFWTDSNDNTITSIIYPGTSVVEPKITTLNYSCVTGGTATIYVVDSSSNNVITSVSAGTISSGTLNPSWTITSDQKSSIISNAVKYYVKIVNGANIYTSGYSTTLILSTNTLNCDNDAICDSGETTANCPNDCQECNVVDHPLGSVSTFWKNAAGTSTISSFSYYSTQTNQVKLNISEIYPTCGGEEVIFKIYNSTSPNTEIKSGLTAIVSSNRDAVATWTISSSEMANIGSGHQVYFSATLNAETKSFANTLLTLNSATACPICSEYNTYCRCGNGICDNGLTGSCSDNENIANCPADCLPSVTSATASWWNDAMDRDYTNSPTTHPAFDYLDSSSSNQSGKIVISGIKNADGQSATINIYNKQTGALVGSATNVSLVSNDDTGTIIGTWTIAKSLINSATTWSQFTPRVTLTSGGESKVFTDWMNVSIGQSVVCDLTNTVPTLNWGSSAASIQEGATYTASILMSGINAMSGTLMTLKIYDTTSSTPIYTKTVTVSNGAVSTSYSFSGLSIGTHNFYYTLTGCSNPSQEASSSNLAITVNEVQDCTSNCGDEICCDDAGEVAGVCVADCGPLPPSFNNAIASWLKNGEVNESDTILTGSINNIYSMRITGIEYAENSGLYFDVYEYDAVGTHETLQTSISSIVSGGEAYASFSIDEATLAAIKELGEPPYKLYFKARIGDLTGDFVNNQLELNVADSGECSADCGDGICCANAGESAGVCVADCGDFPMDISNAIGVWSEDNLSIIEGTSGTRTLSISGITHVPIGGAQIAVNLWEEDSSLAEGYSDEHTQTVYVNVQSDGTATAAITIMPSDIAAAGGNENVNDNPDLSPYEFYAIITYGADSKTLDDILEVFVENTVTCLGINICADYTEATQCSDDLCEVANNSVPAGIDCSNPNTNCYCDWNTTTLTCGPKYNINDPDMPEGVSSIGSCAYNEDMSTDDCNDGFLSYSWTALWTWGEGNNFTAEYYNALTDPNKATKYFFLDGFYRYNPNRDDLACVLGQNTIPCPAQVQLSGFSWINLVIALIIVALIYWLFIIDKKKKSKQQKKVNSSVKKKRR